MTTQEAIAHLEILKSIIEWDYSLDYQIALDMAIKAMREGEKEHDQGRDTEAD